MYRKFYHTARFALIFIPVFFCACEIDVKSTEDPKNYKIFYSGKWAVEKFDSPSASFLSEYAGYELMFSQNGSLTAIFSGSVVASGTWRGSTDKYEVEINLSVAANPLKRFNGTWQIYYGSASVIRCTRPEGTEQYTCWLKQL